MHEVVRTLRLVLIVAVLVAWSASCASSVVTRSSDRDAAPGATSSGSRGEIASHDGRVPGLRTYSNGFVGNDDGATRATADLAEPQSDAPLRDDGDSDGQTDPELLGAHARIVVYEASVELVVEDREEAAEAIQALVEAVRGYVAQRRSDLVVVRVPAAEFEAAMDALGELGQIVDQERVALDVTERYVDLRAQLVTAERVRTRLIALLEMATTVEDMLKVERELSRVDGRIERLKGQLQLLESRVSMSRISIQLTQVAQRQVEIVRSTPLPFRWLRNVRPDRLWNPR